MAVTYPIAFPSNLGVSSFQYGIRVAVGETVSPFSFSEQVIDWLGERWEIKVGLPNMLRDNAEAFNTFLLKLHGKKGTFLMGDPNGQVPRGIWGTTPLVKGAGQSGDTLIIDGLTINTVGVVKAGDYFQLGTGASSRLYKVLDDANSDGTGTATLNIAPSLRSTPADNAAIVYNGAKGVFRLIENITPIDINSNSIYGISFSAKEASL